MSQQSLFPGENDELRRSELRRQIALLAAALGWRRAELDKWCSATYGAVLVGLTESQLEAIFGHFAEVRKHVSPALDRGSN